MATARARAVESAIASQDSSVALRGNLLSSDDPGPARGVRIAADRRPRHPRPRQRLQRPRDAIDEDDDGLAIPLVDVLETADTRPCIRVATHGGSSRERIGRRRKRDRRRGRL
jgi:hypothetical protein